jgi:uncharacterized protein
MMRLSGSSGLSRVLTGQHPLPAVLTVLLACNLLNNRLAPWAYLATCLLVAALLVVLARRSGCSWSELGLGRESVRSGLRWAAAVTAVVLLGYIVAVLVPISRQAFHDDRVGGLPGGGVLWRALIRVPLGTALLEEVAFRGVLYALLARQYGLRRAVLISSLLFGLWHVLPSLGIAEANEAVGNVVGTGTTGTVLAGAGAVAGTAIAGVLLCELRRRSGSLIAPYAVHWALNGFAYALAWALAAR